MATRSWTCPYCNHKAILQSGDVSLGSHAYGTRKFGPLVLSTGVQQCPNDQCSELVVMVWAESNPEPGKQTKFEIPRQRLRPNSKARPWPAYIPQPLLADYAEACQIELLSPKASAALSRRCLQGMIRDFWNVSRPRLADEVNALQTMVDRQTWEAIDALRKSGNIGAHMEKDINLIVDADADEARLLIELIETLLEEWYVGRHDRELRMQKFKAAAEAKKGPPASAAKAAHVTAPAGATTAPPQPTPSAGTTTATLKMKPEVGATTATLKVAPEVGAATASLKLTPEVGVSTVPLQLMPAQPKKT
jgi:hypothetical protein